MLFEYMTTLLFDLFIFSLSLSHSLLKKLYPFDIHYICCVFFHHSLFFVCVCVVAVVLMRYEKNICILIEPITRNQKSKNQCTCSSLCVNVKFKISFISFIDIRTKKITILVWFFFSFLVSFGCC